MLSTILSAFTVAEIRKKLAFTALLLALYRLGSHIPVPGVSADAVNALKEQSQFNNGGVLQFLVQVPFVLRLERDVHVILHLADGNESERISAKRDL